MFERFLYRKAFVVGINTNCPKCNESYLKSKEILRKQYKRRTEVYMQCQCGCKYKYYFGI